MTAIYELELTGVGDLGTINLRYKEPGTDEALETSKKISSISSFETSSVRFRKAIAMARFAQILKLTQPPPTVTKVYEIMDSIESKDEYEQSFMQVLSNAKRMIEIKGEQE